MSRFEFSHSVAVTGYVYQGGRFLLLKRANPPLIWAPPGGRLLPNEDPKQGVLREVLEETGLRTKFLAWVDYWFGEIGDRGSLLSLDFVVIPESLEVRLSEEHTEFVWSSLADLRAGRPNLGSHPWCYSIGHFAAAEKKAKEILETGEI